MKLSVVQIFTGKHSLNVSYSWAKQSRKTLKKIIQYRGLQLRILPVTPSKVHFNVGWASFWSGNMDILLRLGRCS